MKFAKSLLKVIFKKDADRSYENSTNKISLMSYMAKLFFSKNSNYFSH